LALPSVQFKVTLFKRAAKRIPALARFDFESFRQQAVVFGTLNLFLLAALLLLHSLFSSLLGSPSPALLIILGTAFLLKMLELLWLWAGVGNPSRMLADLLVWASILLNITLALALTFLTNRGESPYFVLLAIPVLQAAYRFRLPTLIAVIVICDAMTLFWVWYFGEFHSPMKAIEYLESGVLSVVYALMGSLVWLLVNQLRSDQGRLAHSLEELERTRGKLLEEEKLAMAGRLSSAVAHEIRNPVSIISSSLVTAARPELGEAERKDMYEIAGKEAARLEKLTADFLTYARPTQPQRVPTSIAQTLGYLAEIANVHAAKRNVKLGLEVDDELQVNIDRDQVQRAVLNLLLNAIDASAGGGQITLRGHRGRDGAVELEVENSGEPIPKEALSRIFEPFYTTKAQGTGLGLAISKSIAKTQGGDLTLTRNEGGRVCFTLSIGDEEPAPGANNHG
jgi:signal transduction histidine kinase